jgi:hypothetical protein
MLLLAVHSTVYSDHSSCLYAAPMQKQSTLRMGPAIMEASTRGVTR